MLRVIVEKIGETVVLHCIGRMAGGHEAAILCPAIREGKHEIALDLSRVRAIDAGGIGSLISLQAAGIYLRLLNPSSAIQKVLRASKLDSIFEICSSPLSKYSRKSASRGHSAGRFLRPAPSRC